MKFFTKCSGSQFYPFPIPDPGSNNLNKRGESQENLLSYLYLGSTKTYSGSWIYGVQKVADPQHCFLLKCNSYLYTYDLYSPMQNDFDASRSITRASGRGLGHGKWEFYGPCETEMALSRYASAIWGPKNLRFLGPNPLSLVQVMDLPASKIITYRENYPGL